MKTANEIHELFIAELNDVTGGALTKDDNTTGPQMEPGPLGGQPTLEPSTRRRGEQDGGIMIPTSRCRGEEDGGGCTGPF